ncbi:hypothetical protein [Psychromonas ossibalaenae]|uniref:hypothetical protein n=1 Tax=Psychromonas ossibalaenae TaxID=444922 RepID=UPI00039BE960|nr:hypothetical protein [Psychromonas ossibalaenae]
MVIDLQSDIVLALLNLENLIVEKPQQAEKKVLKAYSKAEEQGDGCAQLLATIQLARISWHLMQYKKGLRLCERAEQLLLPEFESQYLAELYHIYALQHWGLARFRSAHHFWNMAMEKSLVHNQLPVQIESLIGVANIWRINQESELSYSALSLAMTLAEQFELNFLAGKSAILLASSLCSLDQYSLMLEVLDKAESFLQNCQDLAWRAQIQELKCQALLNLGRLSEAELAAHEALSITVSSRKSWLETSPPICAAQVAVEQLRFDKARQLLDTAESTALRFNQFELLAKLYRQRFELEKHLVQIECALRYYKKYRKYEVKFLQVQSIALGKDKCNLTVELLNNKAQHLIERLEAEAFDVRESGFTAFRESSIWLYSCERASLHKNSHVFVFELNNEKDLITFFPFAHALCRSHEVITRFKNSCLAILFQLESGQQSKMYDSLTAMLAAFPWWRGEENNHTHTVKHFYPADFLSYLDNKEGCNL